MKLLFEFFYSFRTVKFVIHPVFVSATPLKSLNMIIVHNEILCKFAHFTRNFTSRFMPIYLFYFMNTFAIILCSSIVKNCAMILAIIQIKLCFTSWKSRLNVPWTSKNFRNWLMMKFLCLEYKYILRLNVK